ncbi:MAG: multidrug transporter AcrB [Thiobacillus sp. 65-69]|nr:efflux RND transporter permease subunit [Thiobacillus sp.]ODU89241.1 MAG: multidrug transporter AcrB [Thiobacillus sp. SCN 65-179]OJW34554.1 MAG: multidrug transporter AcrB [Thiobacillus sp. 65-69]
MFKWLLDTSLANRLLVIVIGLALTAYGAYTLKHTPVDVFPDLDRPTVTVMVEAGGMAAEEAEQLIALPLETAMNGLPGVENVRSVSSAGLVFVYAVFDWSTDLYRARQMVAERLSAMEDGLPPGIVPRLGPVSSIMGEIMQIAIPIDPARIDPMQVREYADWVLRPRLMAIPGVAQAIPIGGAVRQFQVHPDSARMAALGITRTQLIEALRGYAANTTGGFLERNGREYLIRHLGRTARLDDLENLALTAREGRPILLRQIADVAFAPAVKRGDAGFAGKPAVILGIQKQPAADTLALTHAIEAALADLARTLPAGMDAPRVTFRQASFIEASIGTLEGKLVAAALFVAVILFLFLGTLRPTLIALTAIPVSIFVTVLVFRLFGQSINTMTLGGLAIAIGGLVDDAVVGVENVLRRFREDRACPPGERPSVRARVAAATMEVRSAILYATVIIVLVFLPLFALPGMEGRLFVPLGIAFIVSTLASLIVSVTLTPVLAAWLLPGMRTSEHDDTRLLAMLKQAYRRSLHTVLDRPRAAVAAGVLAACAAAATVPLFPRTFLPPFNEGTLLIGLRLAPGVTLAESAALAQQAERLVAAVPDVTYVGRRSGRAELDEHAEGVHVSELDVGLKPAAELSRPMADIVADLRARLAVLPAAVAIGQPISHRIDHMLSGVRAPIAIRLFGEDLDTLRVQAEALRTRLAGIPGIADLEIEKQVLTPQIKVRVDYAAAAQYGVPAPQLLAALQSLVGGEKVAQVAEGNRRFDLVVRLPDAARAPERLGSLLLDTPAGPVPLARLASIEDGDGPNQISRDDGRRRIVLSANTQGRPLSGVASDIRAALAEAPLPTGYFAILGGQFQAQEDATRRVALLALVSAVLAFAVLYSRYRSPVLAALVMANIPLALVGAVAGLWLSGQPLSVAALIGFIALAGISVRNGILKISHYLNLMRSEGEAFDRAMILRGSLERLSPVLMTALVTAFALAPLLFEAERPGTEILYPVAVVIFSGLIGSTLLDAYLTPALFWLFGRRDATRLAAARDGDKL